jgi:uncharacterized protein YkwD
MVIAATAVLAICLPSSADSDVLNELNAIRAAGCDGRAGVPTPLRENAQLADAATRAATSRPFQAALDAAGYRAARSVMIHVSGGSGARSIAGFVASNYCASLLDAAYREIGIHRSRRDTWIVLAAPFAPPDPGAADSVARRVLELVNEARMQSRMCGDSRYASAGLLKLNATLSRVALGHAADMAQHGYLAHEGRDGSTAAERVTRADYRWRSVGENIASGPTTPEAVVAGWLGSPGHCANLMAPQFIEMGVAYAVNRESRAGIYWAQVFAAPR